ncbi:hypothetical protein LXA43DRAFT_1148890 [Ganoderma leucocontextum]|nr:hypothetical protein LXA43DRAFT_1148890 [Ganoderma leucocontextum]
MFPSSLTSLTSLLPLALSFAPFSTLWGDAPPTVQLDQATIYGTTNGSVTSYLNIPFAEPPIGDLRLRLPKAIDHYNGTIDATQVGPQCIQPESEDCLNLNVLVPAGTTPDANLPVVVYIYGGGCSVGSNTQFNGEVMVQRSIEMGQLIIYAAINYRLNAVLDHNPKSQKGSFSLARLKIRAYPRLCSSRSLEANPRLVRGVPHAAPKDYALDQMYAHAYKAISPVHIMKERTRNPRNEWGRGFSEFLDEHRYPTVTQLAVDFDMDPRYGSTLSGQGNHLRMFVGGLPNLCRLDVLGKTIRDTKAPSGAPVVVGKTLGYVCEVAEHLKNVNKVEYVDNIRAELGQLERLLKAHLAAGGPRLHRLEMCIMYSYPSPDSHPSRRVYPYVHNVPPSLTGLTAYLASTYLPRFRALVDAVVFVGHIERRSPGIVFLQEQNVSLFLGRSV